MINNAYDPLLINNFINKSEEFIDLLTQETTLLQTYDLDRALELLPLKQSCAAEHQNLLNNLTKSISFDQLSKSELNPLKLISSELNEALLRNEEALTIVHQVQEGIFNEITNAIREQESSVCQYAQDKRQNVNVTPITLSVINQKV